MDRRQAAWRSHGRVYLAPYNLLYGKDINRTFQPPLQSSSYRAREQLSREAVTKQRRSSSDGASAIDNNCLLGITEVIATVAETKLIIPL